MLRVDFLELKQHHSLTRAFYQLSYLFCVQIHCAASHWHLDSRQLIMIFHAIIVGKARGGKVYVGSPLKYLTYRFLYVIYKYSICFKSYMIDLGIWAMYLSKEHTKFLFKRFGFGFLNFGWECRGKISPMSGFVTNIFSTCLAVIFKLKSTSLLHFEIYCVLKVA